MTTYLEKSCSFGFEGRMWDRIMSVPDHCLSFYFSYDVLGTQASQKTV